MKLRSKIVPAWQKGFTLIELLVVIGIIGILAAVVLVAVNPGRQFASARDSQRRSDLYSITNAIYQYSAENDGNLPVEITTAVQELGTCATCIDFSALSAGTQLAPTYLASIPYDPSTGDDLNTQYWVYLDANGRVVASAGSELTGQPIEVVR